MNDYSVKTDSDLVKLTLCGDSKAYEELVVRHERAVKGTAIKVTGNEYSAKDASQDAFVSAWMHLDALREHDKFHSWVCSIAKNHARRLHAHYCAVTPTISLHLLENVDLTDSGEDELLGRLSIGAQAEAERDERLHEAVDALSEKIREAITLHYFEGYSVKDIVAKLSLPQGTVKWRLCEGRRQLRKEYGVVETTYNENESLVRRVMRQVEELKLWRLKNNKTGFEADYRAVLQAVETLDESIEKQYMLADVLMHGVWWLDSKKNDATLARIKEAAEKGGNQDVMHHVLWQGGKNLSPQESLVKIRDENIPYLEKIGFTKTLGAEWFWLGYYYLRMSDHDNALKAFRKVLTVLTPADVYYANALAAIELEEHRVAVSATNERQFEYNASAEEIKTINGKRYFWSQPGFNMGYGFSYASGLLFNASLCDNLLIDPTLKVGECIVGSEGNCTLTFVKDNETVVTPAGTFEHCKVFRVSNPTVAFFTYTETTYCEGVGLVRQRSSGWDGDCEWLLSSYTVNGGDGLLPTAVGNRWNYAHQFEDGVVYDHFNRFEVVYTDDDTTILTGADFIHVVGYDDDSWNGQILKARREYVSESADGSEQLNREALGVLHRAAKLAITPRQKRHTAIARDVMQRIMDSNPTVTPDYTAFGCWDFFDPKSIVVNEEGVTLGFGDGALIGKHHFEWKELRRDLSFDGWKVLYNFLYDMLSDYAEYIWSDKWVPGYHSDKTQYRTAWRKNYRVVLDVLPDETVTTKAGAFENCRRVVINVTPDETYRTGKKEYWFAPNIGIVKMFAYNPDGETEHCTWELTEYSGTGNGYFPVADGLFRRYEPVVLGDGYHAWVEYTFDVEGDSVILFRNACGTRDREAHEADQE